MSLTAPGNISIPYGGPTEVAVVEDIDALWGLEPNHWVWSAGYAVFDSGARDAQNPSGVTTNLRYGLMLGQIASSGLLTHWNPAATNGAENFFGILMHPMSVAPYGTAIAGNVGVRILRAGRLLLDRVLIPGEATRGLEGKALEYVAVRQLQDNFLLNRTLQYLHKDRNVVADVTITRDAHNTRYTNLGATGAVTVTLPTAVEGLVFEFVKLTNQTFTVAGTLTDAAGTSQTSIAVTTGLGLRFVVRSVAGTLRYVATPVS